MVTKAERWVGVGRKDHLACWFRRHSPRAQEGMCALELSLMQPGIVVKRGLCVCGVSGWQEAPAQYGRPESECVTSAGLQSL